MAACAIRPARPADLDALWSLVRRAVAHMNALGNPQWGADYPTREHYEGDLDRGELFAAEGPDGTLLGVACINGVESPEYAAVPWHFRGPVQSIHRLAVDPDAQRQGVASAFFDFAEAKARAAGCGAIHLDTYSRNDRMQALLERRGYLRRGEIHLHGRPLPYPCYEKQL